MYQADKVKKPEWKKYAKSNLPMKYIDHNIEDFRILGSTDKEKQHNQKMFDEFMDYYNNAETYLRQGTGLILCGSVGIAKTWLMTHLAKKIISVFDQENGRLQEENLLENPMGGLSMTYKIQPNRFYYIQATTLSQYVFASGLNESELGIRRGIKKIAGLWIDDLSKLAETKSGHEISFLDDILRWRDLNALTTFYTSQLPFDSFKEFDGLDKAISKPIHDLIRGNCKVLTLRGESQR
jgi:DNA replication protein DnaC